MLLLEGRTRSIMLSQGWGGVMVGVVCATRVVVLLLVGGVSFSVGVVVYATPPGPRTRWFGSRGVPSLLPAGVRNSRPRGVVRDARHDGLGVGVG